MADAVRPIIIIKKKVSHGGHHGGAWKVAYADFVTAMMALFIVLWLLNSSKQVREAVGGYFKDPTGKSKKVGNGQVGSGDNFALSKNNMDKLKDELQKAVRKVTTFEKFKDQIDMTVTSEGLRIELLESDVGIFFPSGGGEPTGSGKELLAKLAEEIGKLPNTVLIEGHTDSKPFSKNGSYGNWELSSDRANSARRLMQQSGLGPAQVTQVRGFADQHLRKPKQPQDSSNRRISLMVQYLQAPEEDDDKPAAGGGEHHGGKTAEKGGEKGAEKSTAAAHDQPTQKAPAAAPNQPAEKPSPAAGGRH